MTYANSCGQHWPYPCPGGCPHRGDRYSSDQLQHDADAIEAQLRADARDREARAQLQHEADDPHCTCNDCMDSFARRTGPID